jgi:hypothetical protein
VARPSPGGGELRGRDATLTFPARTARALPALPHTPRPVPYRSAAAISIYGLDSPAALATVVGVLVEVPVMLALVQVCNALRPALERRIAVCDQVCDWANRLDPANCGSGGCCGGGGKAKAAEPSAKHAATAEWEPLPSATPQATA